MYLTLIFMAATIPGDGGGSRRSEWYDVIIQTLRELFSVLVDWLTPEKMLAGVILLAFYLYLRSQHQKQHERVEATYYKPDLEPLPYEEEPPIEAAAAHIQTAPSATASSNGLPDDPFYAVEAQAELLEAAIREKEKSLEARDAENEHIRKKNELDAQLNQINKIKTKFNL